MLRMLVDARALSRQLARDASAEEAPPMPMEAGAAGRRAAMRNAGRSYNVC